MHNTISDISEKIIQIEEQIDTDSKNINTNRMPAKKYMIFLLIGVDTEVQDTLKRKVRNLLSNPSACEFLTLTELETSEQIDELVSNVEKILLESSKNHVEVQDLNNVLVCPIIFTEKGIFSKTVMVLDRVDQYMRKSGRSAIWQPFLVNNIEIAQYKNIYDGIQLILDFYKTEKSGVINRCCILGNHDEKNFEVPLENILQTIASTAVLQNTDTMNADSFATFTSKIRLDTNEISGDKIFYTSRNIAISNPKRSYIFSRMNEAIEYFAGDTDVTSQVALDRLDYSFVKMLIRPYYDRLPRCANKITMFPLYAVIEGSDMIERLKKIIETYYYAPLYQSSESSRMLIDAKNEFLKQFFRNNGSLQLLSEAITSGKLQNAILNTRKDYFVGVELDDIQTGNKKTQPFLQGNYLAAKERCLKIIQEFPSKVMEELAKNLTDCEMEHLVNDSINMLEETKRLINEKCRRLQEVEIQLLDDDTNERSNWIETLAVTNQKQFEDLNKKFDYQIYSLMVNNGEEFTKILDICYDAVKTTACTNLEYLKKIGEEFSRNPDKDGDFFEKIRKNWTYTIRFIGRDISNDATCVIGDSDNAFCRNLISKFNATLFDFKNFDRIDVLHLSAAFSPENIREWEEIKKSVKEVE